VLSAGWLAAVVSRNGAAAAVPTTLMNSTVKAAAMIAAGQATVAGVVPAKVALLTEGVLKAMLLSKLKTLTAGLLLVALLIGAAGAIYQTQAAEPPKKAKKNRTATEVAPPPRAAEQREYVIRTRLLEAGPDRPKEVLCPPKVTVDDGQLVPISIADGAQILLEKVGLRETIEIGTFFDVRVKRLGGNKVRLFCRFQRNEVEKSSDNELCVLGSNALVTQDADLHKPVKIVFQKDARGSTQRWVEISVDEQTLPAPAAGVPQQKGGKEPETRADHDADNVD
jgi:hypothetical protein